MLVLTRKPGEGIVVGDDIVITVLDVKGGNIRIGIDAPQDMKIYRQEVHARISRENREATQWDIADLSALSATLQSRKHR